MYTENHKILVKEIKHTNRWNIPYPWIGRISIVKMTILPKAIYRLNTIPRKVPMPFFTVLEEKNVIVCTETQMIPNSQSNLEKEKWHWKNQAPDLRLYYKATIVKTISIVKTI